MVPEADRPQDRELTLAVMANSRKENEHRLALDPRHLSRIPPELRPRVFLETGYGASQGFTDAELAEYVGGFGSHEELVATLRHRAAAQADARRHRGTASQPGVLGLAALRPGQRTHPGGDRPPAHPDRVRGHEPLERRRFVLAARVPQEQRARRVLLGAACPAAHRLHRPLRTAPDSRGDRLRRHRPRRGHSAERPGDPRGRRADPTRHGSRRSPHPFGQDRPVRERRRAHRPGTDRRRCRA